jgi:hypothetical protein
MKIIIILLFSFILMNCTISNKITFDERYSFNESDEYSISNLLNEKIRHFGDTGGFSIIPPESWESTEVPGYENKILFGQKENDYTPSIFFIVDILNVELNTFVNNYFNQLDILLPGDYKLIQRSDFITLKNLKGEKIIVNSLMLGQHYQQIIYFFPGKDNKIIIIVCNTLPTAKTINDSFFDKTVETFEWLSNKLFKEENSFYDQFGEFSITPPIPWRAEEFSNLKYKVLILEKDIYTLMITFNIVTFTGVLNLTNDVILNQMINRFDDSELIKKETFITLNNIIGEKIIVKVSRYEQQYQRQIYYFFPDNKEGKLFIAVCTVLAEASDTCDEIFDRTLETFEWM